MTMQAVIVMSASISVLVTIISNDWRNHIYGLLISWAVILTDTLTGGKR